MKKIKNEQIISFKNHLMEEEKAQNTIEKYMRDIRFFKEWLGDRDLDKTAVLDYKQALCENYAPKSVNSMLSSIHALFYFLGWHELRVKTLKIQRQIFVKQERELTKKEYERLLSAAEEKHNQKLYYLMQTICGCGIRVSELRYITVAAVQTGQAVINCKGKMRVIFLPKELCRMLMQYSKENKIKNGAVFVSKAGKPLDRSYIWKMLKNLCKTAGVAREKVFPHNLRHLFARTYYSLQKDIVRLADILGHTCIDTTRIYTIETGEVHRRQIQKLGLLRC